MRLLGWRGYLDLSGSKSIKFRLRVLLAVLAAPLLAVIAWMAVALADAARDTIVEQRTAFAIATTARIDREILETLGKLKGLAASDDLARGSFAEFQRQARALMSGTVLSASWVFDRHSKVQSVVGSASDTTHAFDLSHQLIEQVATGASFVSGVRSEGLEQASIVLAVPLFASKRVVGGLAAEFKVATLSNVFASAGIPSPWVAAVVDSTGLFVARTLDAESWIGLSARPELVKAARSGADRGEFDNTTHEGMSMSNTFVRSSVTGWTTVIAVPKGTMEAPLRNYLLFTLLSAAATIGFASWLAYTAARRVSEPVHGLGRTAGAWAEGRVPKATRHPLIELIEVERALASAMAKTNHLSALVDSTGDAIVSCGLDGTVLSWNPAAERLFGYSSSEILGQSKLRIVPDEYAEEFRNQLAQIARGDTIRFETERLTRDGLRIVVSINSAPILTPDGKITAASSIIHDISDRVATENHIRLLMNEVAHRAKNQLAVIQSIASQTARSSRSIDEFKDRFVARLHGLATSLTLLLDQDWAGSPVADVVNSHIAAFGFAPGRIDSTGPDAFLAPKAVEALGLALHELATNALKHGAMSNATGGVIIRWGPENAADGSWFINWREVGGPEFRPGADKGFGSQILERLAAVSIGGTSQLTFERSGVEWRMVLPKSMVSPIHEVTERRRSAARSRHRESRADPV